MKHLTKILLALSLVFLAACSKPASEGEVVVDESVPEVTVVENDYYKVPLKPNEQQITLFNDLSALMLKADRTPEQEATLVAKNFVTQFFSFAGKDNRNDVGGMMYIPSTMQADFKSYAQAYFYSHFEELAGKYGKDQLPSVSSVTISNIRSEQVVYKDTMYDGFVMDVMIHYDENKSSEAGDLKTSFTLSMCYSEDYKDLEAADAYIKSLGEGELADQENPALKKNEIYRIISIEE